MVSGGGIMAGAKTWALVSDGVRARIVRGLDEDDPEESIEVVSKAESTHLRDILSDKSGRSFASFGGGRRSGMEPGSDPIRRDMQDFAKETFEVLERHHRAGDFEKLAIFAEPRMLGVLRDEMPSTLHAVVTTEQPVNLVQLSKTELRATILRMLREQD